MENKLVNLNESLITLQDKMRTLCIEEFNQIYSLDSALKQNSKYIKEKIDKLKVSKLNKNNY